MVLATVSGAVERASIVTEGWTLVDEGDTDMGREISEAIAHLAQAEAALAAIQSEGLHSPEAVRLLSLSLEEIAPGLFGGRS